MKELDFLEIIKKTLSKNSHIGDDCALIEELGIVVTQDNLVEDIHFSRKFSTPYQLGYRALAVNLSDIFASGAEPAYATISLSLPPSIDDIFIKHFYKACEDLSKKYDFEIIGGDLTGSNKIYISVCIIGAVNNHKISSRKNAKVGDYVVTTGSYGASTAGLWILKNYVTHKEILARLFQTSNFISKYLNPIPQKNFSNEISTKSERDYAMMDTSDGLIDAAFKIAQASNVLLSLEFDKIPFDTEIKELARMANVDYKDWVLYGGEDYQLVACVDSDNLKKLDTNYTIIGKVQAKTEENFVQINYADSTEKISNLDKTYNHFGDTNEI